MPVDPYFRDARFPSVRAQDCPDPLSLILVGGLARFRVGECAPLDYVERHRDAVRSRTAPEQVHQSLLVDPHRTPSRFRYGRRAEVYKAPERIAFGLCHGLTLSLVVTYKVQDTYAKPNSNPCPISRV
mgnify:CR=1 FL=1